MYFLRNNWFCGVRGGGVPERSQGGPPAPPIQFLIQFLFKLMKILSGDSLLHQYTFLIQFLFKTDEKQSLATHSSSSTHSLFNSYSKLMQILSGANRLLQYTFLIQFLCKTDTNPLWRQPPPPVHILYSILIQN